jgi:hypothetical protein
VIDSAVVVTLVDLDSSPERLAAAAALAGPDETALAREIIAREIKREQLHLAAIDARLDGLAVEAKFIQ